jgi:hypothetical protein
MKLERKRQSNKNKDAKSYQLEAMLKAILATRGRNEA